MGKKFPLFHRLLTRFSHAVEVLCSIKERQLRSIEDTGKAGCIALSPVVTVAGLLGVHWIRFFPAKLNKKTGNPALYRSSNRTRTGFPFPAMIESGNSRISETMAPYR